MGKFSLENRIKERLEGHEVHVNKQELWKSLGIEDDEKDRKAFWLWWLAGAFGIILVTSTVWFLQSETKEGVDIQYAKETQVDENVAKTGNETNEETSTTELLTEIIEDVAASESTVNQASDGQLESRELDTKATSSRLENSNSASKTNTTITGFDREDMNSEKKVVPTNEVSKETNNSSSIENENVLVENDDVFVENNNGNTTTIMESDKEEVQTFDITLLDVIDTRLTFNREFEALEMAAVPFIEPIPAAKRFEFEVFGGIGSINRDITPNADNFEGYVLTRDTSETALEQVSLGASFKCKIGGGIYGKVGLTLNRWNEKFQYSEVSDTMFESVNDIPIKILIDLQGNETITYGEGESTTITTTHWTRYNRLTQIDLPLTLGYEKNIGRWSAFGEVAAIFNLSQTFKGYQYNFRFEVVENSAIYKSNIGVNLGLNAGIGYGITPRLRARLSARYFKIMDSVTDLEVANQKNSSLGLRLGVGYLF